MNVVHSGTGYNWYGRSTDTASSKGQSSLKVKTVTERKEREGGSESQGKRRRGEKVVKINKSPLLSSAA